MSGVDRRLYVQSTSGNDGTLNQVVTFDIGTDIDVDNVLVNNRFSQAQPFLPADVRNDGVTVKKSLVFPLKVFSLYSPDSRYDPTFLANYGLVSINDALLRVRGVGDVRNFGSSEYAMRVVAVRGRRATRSEAQATSSCTRFPSSSRTNPPSRSVW